MRAKTDPTFCDYILRVGNGLKPTNHEGHIKLPLSLVVQPTTIVPSLDDLIRFVFPSFEIYVENPLSITESAILTPKNQAVDEINEAMISKFPGEQATYLSFDEIDDPME